MPQGTQAITRVTPTMTRILVMDAKENFPHFLQFINICNNVVRLDEDESEVGNFLIGIEESVFNNFSLILVNGLERCNR